MKKLLTFFMFIVGVNLAYSQNYDLIVKTNGDSIACRIDSITGTHIYFKMKNRENWIHTNINKEVVSVYQSNIVDWKNYVYKPGTSFILSLKNPVNSIWDNHKNSIYIGYNIWTIPAIYERTIPLSDKTGLLAGGGIIISVFGSVNPVAKTGIIFGNGKHFVEGGLYIDLLHYNENINLLISVLGYRYQAPGGFLFRVDLALIMMGISIGYSF